MKKQGMSWLKKTGQVLLLTLLAMMFMGEGWYAPKTSLAANVTRYLVNNNATVISANEGSTNAATTGTSVAGTTTLAAWRSFFATAAGATDFNLRITAATTGTWYKLMRFYVSANYATATQISGTPTYRFGARSTNLTDQYQAYLIDFDPAGAAGNGTVITSTAVINSPNTGTYTEVAGNFTAIATPYTVAAGHRLVLEVRFKPGVAAATGRLAFGSINPGYNASIVANETAVVTDTTPPTAGTVTVNPTVGIYTSAAPTITTVFTDTQSAVTSCEYTTTGVFPGTAGVVSGTGPYTCTGSPTGRTGALTINMRATSTGGTGTATAVTRTVDAAAPTGGTVSATAGNTQNMLSWTAASDTSGVASYILRFATGAAPASCAVGTAVPGSPFSGATLTATHTGLTNGTQYFYRLCATDAFGFSTAGTTASATPISLYVPVITSCDGCHGNPPVDGTRAGATGLFPGSHTIHTATANYAYACTVCHRNATTFNHANNRINMVTAIDGVAASRYKNVTSLSVINTAPAFGSCNTSKCHGTNSPNWGATASSTRCTKCHGQANYAYLNTSSAQVAPGGTGVDTAGLTTSNRVGTHQAHLLGSTGMSRKVHCGDCHTVVQQNTTAIKTHLNMSTATVSFSALANGSKAATPRVATVSKTGGQMTCTNTYCHKGYTAIGGTATAPAFNNAALLSATITPASCSVCHGLPPSTSGSHGSLAQITAFNTTQLSNCTGCHSTLNVNGTSYTTIFTAAGVEKHIDGNLDGGGHAYPYGGSVHMPGGTGSPLADAPAPYSNCSGCHNNISAGGGYPVATGNAVLITCGNCHINYTNFISATPGCWDCHGSSATNGMPNSTAFPNLAGSHLKHVTGQGMACVTCHTGGGTGSVNHGSGGGAMTSLGRVNVAPSAGQFTFSWAGGTGKGTCSNVTGCHGTAEWGVTTFNCVTCHNGPIAINNGVMGGLGNFRRNVSVEFMSTWSHFRSLKGGTITTVGSIPPAACIVCHMEGNPATGGQMASYHGNGYIELRDPDTGVTVQNVAWVSAAGAGNGWYTSTGTVMNTMAAFRRNLASATLEPQVQATQINFCIKCHDNDGALSTLARYGGATTPALRPFNIAIRDWVNATAMSSLGNNNGSGNVIDVEHHLLTSNASYHPVLGKANNGYARGLRMAAPWNGTAQVMGTNTSYGYLISCWDCHGAPSYAFTSVGGTSQLMTFSVTAHGAPATLRGLTRGGTLGTIGSNNLCANCHRGYAGNSNHVATAFGTSAYNSGGSSMGGSMKSCHYCHGSGIGISSVPVNGSTTLAEALVRPLRSEDAHGFNERYANVAGSTWASGNRPYSFIRNTLTSWRPARSPETANNTGGICTGIIGRTCDDNMGGTYAPGGAY